MLVHRFYIILSGVPVQVSCQFLIELFAILILSPSSERCFANVSMLWLIYSFLIVYFDEQKFFFFILHAELSGVFLT